MFRCSYLGLQGDTLTDCSDPILRFLCSGLQMSVTGSQPQIGSVSCARGLLWWSDLEVLKNWSKANKHPPMAWKRWKRASSTAAGSAEALSSSWHVTLPIGLQLPKWWLAGFHKIWLEIRNLLFGHLEPEEITWPLVVARAFEDTASCIGYQTASCCPNESMRL